jgi:hypothetical protein
LTVYADYWLARTVRTVETCWDIAVGINGAKFDFFKSESRLVELLSTLTDEFERMEVYLSFFGVLDEFVCKLRILVLDLFGRENLLFLSLISPLCSSSSKDYWLLLWSSFS